MAKSIDEIKKEVEGLSEIASENTPSHDRQVEILSALIISQGFHDLADAIREAGKEIADHFKDII